MTTSKKTFKDQREQKELHEFWRGRREGKKESRVKGGHENLLTKALKELEEDEADPE